MGCGVLLRELDARNTTMAPQESTEKVPKEEMCLSSLFLSLSSPWTLAFIHNTLLITPFPPFFASSGQPYFIPKATFVQGLWVARTSNSLQSSCHINQGESAA